MRPVIQAELRRAFPRLPASKIFTLLPSAECMGKLGFEGKDGLNSSFINKVTLNSDHSQWCGSPCGSWSRPRALWPAASMNGSQEGKGWGPLTLELPAGHWPSLYTRTGWLSCQAASWSSGMLGARALERKTTYGPQLVTLALRADGLHICFRDSCACAVLITPAELPSEWAEGPDSSPSPLHLPCSFHHAKILTFHFL